MRVRYDGYEWCSPRFVACAMGFVGIVNKSGFYGLSFCHPVVGVSVIVIGRYIR